MKRRFDMIRSTAATAAVIGCGLGVAACSSSDADPDASAAAAAGPIVAAPPTPPARSALALPAVAVRTDSAASKRAQAPDLPFSFVGSWRSNDRVVIYLRRGPALLTVSAPGPIDPEYEVLAIDERQLVLNYRPLGVRQTLALQPRGTVQPSVATGSSLAQAARAARLRQALPAAAEFEGQMPEN